MMATCSLTDEEKQKLEDILADLNEIIPDDDDKDHETTSLDDPSDDEEQLLESFKTNAYKVTTNDKGKLEDIDRRLSEFGEKYRNGDEQMSQIENGSRNWKEFILQHNLKDINGKLREVREAFARNESELAKKKELPSILNAPDDEVSGEYCRQLVRKALDEYERSYKGEDDDVSMENYDIGKEEICETPSKSSEFSEMSPGK